MQVLLSDGVFEVAGLVLSCKGPYAEICTSLKGPQIVYIHPRTSERLTTLLLKVHKSPIEIEVIFVNSLIHLLCLP